ncbi:hypothetical protein EKO29_07885 [Colwellia sp. Arc7-635]|jgi:hypothetical protein|uniref:hypothetical protein n=1 Tax=Colwellia sp. Arc7-635 TaxID=2497879 RepID=UPI000F858CBC|nr:hypothetical protein [Colwellia sp. Arc7-635]AZQ83940.1 hypothetical protein EKO29_07885 [Colwellia sp. Arc7-635]
MKITTSFGLINIISANIAEIIVNEDVEITLEIVDEYDAVMAQTFPGNYAILVNKINNYRYAFEALLTIASAENQKATAIISYGIESEQQTTDLKTVRRIDNLNMKEFSGLNLGRASAIKWLNEQLTIINSSETVT